MATHVEQPKPRSVVPIGGFGRLLVCLVAAFVVLAPLGVAVMNGLKSKGQVVNRPFSLPDPVLWSNYTDILRSHAFWRQLGNSALVMLATTFLILAFASAAAFVFARMPFRGREFLFTFYVLGLLFPLAVAILPVYLLIRELGLVDTLWGIILPQVAFLMPLSVLILRNFFLGVPNELEDAAYVDGATAFQFFTRILLPLARPGLAAVAVLTMVYSWNNFFLPLVVLNSEKHWTLPLGVMQYSGQYSSDWGAILAFVTLAMLPAIIFYLFAERQIIAGLTAGSLKG
ncbi:MAG TPA: carbohydrate ABC transporter permease [Thermomicrobiales bacterium]|nr:carbohydrate ABC transporter permease [Thermomicrobiales bacterium]